MGKFRDLVSSVGASTIHVASHGYERSKVTTIAEVTFNPVLSKSAAFERPAFECLNAWDRLSSHCPDQLNVAPDSVDISGRTVAVFSVPTQIIAHLKRLRLEMAQGLITHSNYQSTTGRIHDELGYHLRTMIGWEILKDSYAGGGFYSSFGPCGHVTVNERSGKQIGLHVDSWDRANAEMRRFAQNRVCINLGDSPRAFMFCPIECSAIPSILSLANESERCDQLASDGFVEQFLQLATAIPVVRLWIRPNEAYIAPTENLIHDAATLSREDITYTYRGVIASPVSRSFRFQ